MIIIKSYTWFVLVLSIASLTSIPTAISAQEPAFLDQVLNDRDCRNCYFISLEVSSIAYCGKVVVENDDLFSFLSTVNGLDFQGYNNYMKDLLRGGKPLILDGAVIGQEGLSLNIEGMGSNQFRIPKTNDDLERILAKGCIETLRQYFLDGEIDSKEKGSSRGCRGFLLNQKKGKLMIKKALPTEVEAALIAHLFDWQIPVRMDDISGRLVIGK